MRNRSPQAALALATVLLTHVAGAQQLEWAWSFEQPELGYRPMNIAEHPDGDVVVSGFFEGTVDFDPGPGVFTMTVPGTGEAFFVSKIHPDGNLAWAFLLDSVQSWIGGGDGPNSLLRVDGNGNIHVLTNTGLFEMVDVDPSADVARLNSTAGYPEAYFVAKYDASGSYIDAFQVGGTYMFASDMVIADDGTLYIAGHQGYADHDPAGPGGLVPYGGGLSPAQITALEADIAAWQQSIENLVLYNRTAIANLDAARDLEAQLLESETGSIASNELIEQNAKAVNQVYLNTIGRSGEDVEFDVGQAATLIAIANQCPLVGGNPVYQARSLYSLIDDKTEFDDALICAADGYVVKSFDGQVQLVNVYPNPNRTGQLFFETSGLEDEAAFYSIVLCDIQGRPVMRQTMSGQIGSLLVSSLAQGLYRWSFSAEGVTIDQGKVIIH